MNSREEIEPNKRHSNTTKSSEQSIRSISSKCPDRHVKVGKISDTSFKSQAARASNEMDYRYANVDCSYIKRKELPLIIDNVKIIPGSMVFKGAYDGKLFKQTLTLINCGRDRVTIRILPPSSKAFQVEPLTIGKVLAPGLSISRTIQYLYKTSTWISQSCMTIVINNKRITYEFIVITSFSEVTVMPQVVNFGEIDIGLVSDIRTVKLTNIGTKLVQFFITHGPYHRELVVHPMKGLIQPKESIDLSIELFGTRTGQYFGEFWIKTYPLQRVQVEAYFIEPTINIVYPLSISNQMILKFAETFIGSRRCQNVVVRNHSSSSAVFRVMALINKELIPFKDVRKRNGVFKHFDICPLEGWLSADQECILTMSFTPKRSITRHCESYFIATILIQLVKCRTGHKQQIQDVSYLESTRYFGKTVKPYITVYLYGELVVPEVTIDPDLICLDKVKINQLHKETLTISNKAENLSIFLKYNKAACIAMDPPHLNLPPNQTPIKATIELLPRKMGDEHVRIQFDLFYLENQSTQMKLGQIHLDVYYTGEYTTKEKVAHRRKPYFNMGITPNIANEVGYLVDDVRFNSIIARKIPRQIVIDRKMIDDSDDLVAFPNDRPKSLRPWRHPVRCKTIFTKLPRLITSYDSVYDLPQNKKQLQIENRMYYENYIRNMLKTKCIKQNMFQDYEVEDKQQLLLMKNLKNAKRSCPIVFKQIPGKSPFGPLSPYEICNVILTPRFLHLGLLATQSESTNFFTLNNRNPFPIHIGIQYESVLITLPEKEFILLATSCQQINFTFRTQLEGNPHILIAIRLNHIHVFDMTVLADVVSNSIKCLTRCVELNPAERFVIIELSNQINSPVQFTIDTTNYYHLEACPMAGTIPSSSLMACSVTFNPDVDFSETQEIVIISESGVRELVTINLNMDRPEIVLNCDWIDFGDIPLNVTFTRSLIVKNNSKSLVSMDVEIDEKNMLPEISINPMKSIIWQKGDLVLNVSAKFTTIRTMFDLSIILAFQYDVRRQIRITGNVVFPKIIFSPTFLKFPEIPAGSLTHMDFKILNKSNVENWIEFLLEDYPEFCVEVVNGKTVRDKVVLNPNESTLFRLQFQPTESIAYSIFIPYILNGIVGPPEFTCPDSLLCSHYLSQLDVTMEKEKLSTLKVLCVADSQWFDFSQLDFDVSQMETFKITNVSDAVHQVWLNIDKLQRFTITPLKFEAIVEDGFMKITLNPELCAMFEIQLIEYSGSEINEELPIYVIDHSEALPFNYLRLHGINRVPTITANPEIVYFTPIGVNSSSRKSVVLQLKDHRCENDVSFQCDCENMSIKLERDQEKVGELVCNVVFQPISCCDIESTLTISCSCQCQIIIQLNAVAHTSILINYLDDCQQCSTYPYFPCATDSSAYGKLMQRVPEIVERWLFSQGFYYRNYYQVPGDICRYPATDIVDDKKKVGRGKTIYPQLPLVQLLINLIDRSILKYIENRLLPEGDQKQRTLYNYVTYRNCISFMKSQHIFVPGLRADHLLDYPEYVIFHQSLSDPERLDRNEKLLEEDEFKAFSKQMWFDLFFKIYKVLVLDRVVNPLERPKSMSNYEEQQPQHIAEMDEFQTYFERNSYRFDIDWYYCEYKLILWAEYHYNKEKFKLWPNQLFEDQTCLHDFTDLQSSVVLACITTSYCPYLIDKFKDIFPFPKNLEQLIHNACRVVQAWKILRLSFDPIPQRIVEGNKIDMLFIVTYLYEVLPHYYPSREINIEAPLSETSTYELNIQNCGNAPIQYKAIFFGTSFDVFQLETSEFIIQNGKKKQVQLTYFAKTNAQITTILVLSGEGCGHKYAKSIACEVKGHPTNASCKEVKINIPIYTSTKKKISVKTPYAQTYMAKIFYGTTALDPESLQSVSDIKSKNIIREIDVEENKCEFIDKGEAKITLNICLISQVIQDFYLYFHNERVGDFNVHVTIRSVPSNGKNTIELPIVNVTNDFSLPCTCKRTFSRKCPRVFSIEIPYRNELFWNAVLQMIQTCFVSGIYELWEKYLDPSVTLRMLKFYIENYPESSFLPASIFSDYAVYDLSHNVNFSTPKPILEISNITQDGTVDLLLHWNGGGGGNKTSGTTLTPANVEYFQLRNINDKETRFYKLIFPDGPDDKVREEFE